MSKTDRNTFDELATKFSKADLELRLKELNSKFAQMLLMDDIQAVIQEKQDIEFILGENEQAK